MKVLIIEDEKMLLEVIVKKLNLSGLDPVACTSGEEGLGYLKGNNELPGVIWLDYHLKGMDGLAFLEEVKKNPRWEKIPVVVVSNSASSDEVHHMLALGVDKYMLKAEYRLDQIIECVRNFISGDKKDEKNIGC